METAKVRWVTCSMLAALLMGCAESSSTRGENAGRGDAASLDSLAPAASIAVPTWSGSLPGSLIVIAAEDDGDLPTNVAWAMDPLDGRRERLWMTEEPQVVDVRLDPTGRRVSYLEGRHGKLHTELLIARALKADAEADYVALLDPDVVRLAGHAWSGDGQALAYGRQGGEPAAFSAGVGMGPWQLHAVAVGGARSPDSSNNQLLWKIEGAEIDGRVLHLVAWSPETQAATVSVANAASGMVEALWLIDTASGEVAERIEPDEPAVELALSADHRRVLWLTLDGGALIIDLQVPYATTRMLDGDGAPLASRPLWSPDGTRVALTLFDQELRSRASGTVVLLREFGAAEGHRLDGTTARQALAFSPDGEYLLMTSGSVDASELVEARLLTAAGDEYMLGWSLPAATWEVFWIADDS